MFIVPTLIETLRRTRHLLVLTGAGASAESGIPTFRDALTGLWSRFDAASLATVQVQNRRAARPFVQVIDVLGDEGQARDPRRQGGDGQVSRIGRGLERLHPPPRVPAPNQVRIARKGIGGGLHAPRCVRCARPFDLAPGVPDEPEGGRRLAPPRCPQCGGAIRPGVV